VTGEVVFQLRLHPQEFSSTNSAHRIKAKWHEKLTWELMGWAIEKKLMEVERRRLKQPMKYLIYYASKAF
jgi:hypothetical protein